MDDQSKNKVGRPLKFKTSEELDLAISKYFDDSEKNGKPLTMSGLAVALDVDRQTLLNYSKTEEFFGTLNKAKAICERYAEEYLFSGKNVTGAMFNLKNNYRWKDRNESDVTVNSPFSLEDLLIGIEERKNERKNETNLQ